MLQIVFKDGTSRNWMPCNFTDYECTKKLFIVICDKQWVGIYNLDEVKSIEYLEIPEDCFECDEAE